MAPRRAAVVAGILAGILLFTAAWLLHPALGPSLRAVSDERLSASGTELLNPFPWDQPQVTRAQAEQIAVHQAPGGPVLQSVLAEVIQTNGGSKQPRLCWVVSLPGSLISSHGPPGSPPRHASYYLVFIDADTGEFVSGSAGG